MPNLTWLYVAAVYAVAVALARRAGADIPKRIALLFYLLVLAFLFRPLTGNYVNYPADVLQGLPPWQYVAADQKIINPEQNDLVLQIVPWAHQVRESWKSLRVPLWNHHAGSGYPLLANGQSSALSLIRFLALPLDLGRAMTAEAAFKILIALTFTFLYCRQRRHSLHASAIAAVMFGLSGFMVSWLHFPLITAACFLPAVLHAVDRLALEPTRGKAAWLAVVWTLMLFGGHPETAAHLFLLTVLYVAWLTLIERRRFLVLFFGAMAVSALLAAPLLAPLLEALPHGRRIHDLRAAPFDPANLPYSDWRSAVLLLQPHFFGRVPLEQRWGPSETEALGGYAGVFGAVAWLALLIHVLRARAWRSREALFVVLTVLIFGLLQAWPVISDLLHFVLPIAAHARLRLLFVFLLAAQAAMAVDLEPPRRLLIGIAGVAVTLVILFLLIKFPDKARLHSSMLAAIPSVFVLLGAAIPRAKTVLAAAIAAELFLFGRNWNAAVPDSLVYPKTALIQALQGLKHGAKEPFRIVGKGGVLFPNTSAIYGFEDIRAHDPMANRRYLEFARVHGDYDYRGTYFVMWDNLETPVLDVLNVRYLVTYPDVELKPPRFALLYSGADGRIYENRTVRPRFDAPGAAASIVEVTPTDYRLRVEAPRETLVMSSIPRWPGWRVTRDGEPLRVRPSGVFLAFTVPAGASSVRVTYAPWTFRLGAAVSIATAVLLLRYGAVRAATAVGRLTNSEDASHRSSG